MNSEDRLKFYQIVTPIAGLMMLIASFQRGPAECVVNSEVGNITPIGYRIPIAPFLAIGGLGLLAGNLVAGLSLGQKEETKKTTEKALSPATNPEVQFPISFSKPEPLPVSNPEPELTSFLQMDSPVIESSVEHPPAGYDAGRLGELITWQKSGMICAMPGTGKTTTLAALLKKIFEQNKNAKVFVCSVKNDSFQGLNKIEWKVNKFNRNGEVESVWEKAVRFSADPLSSKLTQFCELMTSVISVRLSVPESERTNYPNEPIYFIIDDATAQVGFQDRNSKAAIEKYFTNAITAAREAAVFTWIIAQDPNLEATAIQGKAVRSSLAVLSIGLNTTDRLGNPAGGFSSIKEIINNALITPPEFREGLLKDLGEFQQQSDEQSLAVLYENVGTTPRLSLVPDCRKVAQELIDFSVLPSENYRVIQDKTRAVSDRRLPPVPPAPPYKAPVQESQQPVDEIIDSPVNILERLYKSPDSPVQELDGSDPFTQEDTASVYEFSQSDWEMYFPKKSAESTAELIRVYAKGKGGKITKPDVAKSVLGCTTNSETSSRNYRTVGIPATEFLISNYNLHNLFS